MPGLAGFTVGALPPVEARRALGQMRALLSYGESHHLDELFCDGRVCATRSHTGIIQRGPQPHTEGGVRVWLDGEFYNREELERTYGGGEEFASDAALLTALYRRDGDFDFLKAVDGIYSAVVYDETARLVHLVGDRYGLRHLFWSEHAGGIAWASEVKAMLELPGFEPRVDAAAQRDFFEVGHLTGDRTWFEGVELLPSGTVLTWDCEARAARRTRYWSWDDIKPLEGRIDEEELARELGRLFRDSVERRARAGGRTGLTLSGGLDSRAILAALPDGSGQVHAITFGKRGCEDARIAERAARVKGATHHLAELDAGNWLAPRLEGVWRTDGQFNLMHMHVLAVVPLAARLFDVNLDGFLGDATIGGSYLNNHGAAESWNLNNRGRRFISLGPSVIRQHVETRLPFFDNRFLGLVMAAPQHLRRDSRLYRKMLLLTFPELFRDIPWQRTGAPIRWPRPGESRWTRLAAVRDDLLGKLDWYGLYSSSSRGYADYADWIRREPARSFFERVLRDPAALFPAYVPRARVERDLEKHFGGGNRQESLTQALTFELWLQQVFNGKYRPESRADASSSGAGRAESREVVTLTNE